MSDLTPLLLAGDARPGADVLEVRNPWDGSVVGRVAAAGVSDVEEAADAAARTLEDGRGLPGHRRAEALLHVSRRLRERRDEVARLIVLESGKPLKWAAAEADRAAGVFQWAAEEARRDDGEVLRFDADTAAGSRLGIVRRFAAGPVLGITPFNFPVNLVAHKLAPALAAGAPIVIKPAPATPLCALLLGELVAETDLPAGMLSVLPMANDLAPALVRDRRFRHVSFTGSADVGWHLKTLAPHAEFTLELGGNSAVVVHSDADLDLAARKIAVAATYQAGQSCTSVQRVLVHAPVREEFVAKLVEQVRAQRVGDPMDPSTDVGPLISAAALRRVSEWVDAAVEAGASVLSGGTRDDPFYEPTLLTEVPGDQPVWRDEVFGPVASIAAYDTYEDALAQVNDSRFGLQTGVFTRDLERAFAAHRALEVGGVIVNDTSAVRADQMPYGGVKASGQGREGLRSAIEAMTHQRILILSGVPL